MNEPSFCPRFRELGPWRRFDDVARPGSSARSRKRASRLVTFEAVPEPMYMNESSESECIVAFETSALVGRLTPNSDSVQRESTFGEGVHSIMRELFAGILIGEEGIVWTRESSTGIWNARGDEIGGRAKG